MSGLQTIPLRIPERWDPAWFERFVREVLSLADVRNALAGAGIVIEGTSGGPATIAADADLEEIASSALVTALPSNMGTARVLTAGDGIGIEDNGGGSTIVVYVDNVPFGRLQQVPAPSLIGCSIDLGDGTSPPGVIVPDAPERVLITTDDGGGNPVIGFGEVSTLLDFLGSAAEGDILYRGASGWELLPRGTDGQVLTLNSGVPVWADPDSLLMSSFVTVDDETTTLVNSRQITAGDGISFDTSTPGVLEIVNDNP